LAAGWSRAFFAVLWLVGYSNPLFAEALPPTVLAGLESDRVRVRITAVVAVSKSDDPSARAILEGMLSDPVPAVRAAAVEGLGRVGDPRALKALRKLEGDKDSVVRDVVTRTIAALEALPQPGADGGEAPRPTARAANLPRVVVDASDAKDMSGLAPDGMVEKLRRNVVNALGSDPRLASEIQDGAQSGYGLLLRIRKIEERKQDNLSVVEVKCELTLVQLPGKALRMQSAATAAAGIEGGLDDKLRQELISDAIDVCGPELAKDFVDYALPRL